MTYFKNVKYKVLVTLDDDGRRGGGRLGETFRKSAAQAAEHHDDSQDEREFLHCLIAPFKSCTVFQRDEAPFPTERRSLLRFPAESVSCRNGKRIEKSDTADSIFAPAHPPITKFGTNQRNFRHRKSGPATWTEPPKLC